MSRQLRVGVPRHLLELQPVGGHGKVWHRVLTLLRSEVRIEPLPSRRLRRQRPDVVLASGHEDLPATEAPLVAEVHEAGWFEPELRRSLDHRFLAYIAPRTEHAVRVARHVVTLSRAARHDLVMAYGLDPERVHAIPLGVDRTFRPGVPGGREIVAHAVIHDLASTEPPPYVLYAATLHPRKNLEALRAAFARLAGMGFPHLLAIAGMAAPDRPDSAELEAAAAAALPGVGDRVVRVPAVTDHELASLMAGAEAFCLPSLYEGFGLSALEAMACGAPVVVSNRGALPEVVGDAGVVVEPTAEQIAGALASLLRDPERARRLRLAAAERARTFTWEKTAAGWLRVLLLAAERERPGPPYTRRR